jgi:hypothetical protein
MIQIDLHFEVNLKMVDCIVTMDELMIDDPEIKEMSKSGKGLVFSSEGLLEKFSSPFWNKDKVILTDYMKKGTSVMFFVSKTSNQKC